MPLPDNMPMVFAEALSDQRQGSINLVELRKRITDAIVAEPALQAFKDQHLRYIDYDDSAEFID